MKQQPTGASMETTDEKIKTSSKKGKQKREGGGINDFFMKFYVYALNATIASENGGDRNGEEEELRVMHPRFDEAVQHCERLSDAVLIYNRVWTYGDGEKATEYEQDIVKCVFRQGRPVYMDNLTIEEDEGVVENMKLPTPDTGGEESQWVVQIRIVGGGWINWCFRQTEEECEDVVDKNTRMLRDKEYRIVTA